MTDLDADPVHPSQRLPRVLGIVFGLAVVIGGVIGSGIMRAPGVVALGVRDEPLTLLLWLAGGGVAMLAAMPMVEAGASVPRAGGSYAIAARAFGPTTGFMVGWLNWLQLASSNAFIAVVFGEYVQRLGFATALPTAVIAVGLIAAMAAINLTGSRISGASQSIASGVKGAAFLLVAVVLFLSPRAPAGFHPSAVVHPVLAGAAAINAIIMAVRVIYQTYAGWDIAIYFSEDVQRPDRNIARATFTGIGLVTVVYLLVNAAVMHVLAPDQIAGSKLAVGDAVKVSLGAAGDTAITALGALSLAAIVNLQIMAASRITYRMARDGVLPRFLATVSPGGAPRRSVLVLALASALFAGSGSYEAIVRVYAPWGIGGILIICLSSIRLRYKEPALPRPFVAPLFPWISIFAALIQAALIAMVLIDDPASGAWSAVVLAAPLPLYLFLTRHRAAPAAI